MKTLREIIRVGKLAEYTKDLGAAVQAILPSTDGNPDHPCFFVLLFADDGGAAHYVGNTQREKVIDWLRETAFRLERNLDTSHLTTKPAGNLPQTRNANPDGKCPVCGGKLDAGTMLTRAGDPAPGDVAVCIHCAAVNVYDETLKPRLPTPDEKKEMETDVRVIDAVEMTKEIIEKKRAENDAKRPGQAPDAGPGVHVGEGDGGAPAG